MLSPEVNETPCPVASGIDAFSPTYSNDTTFNFTSAFRPSLHGAKPRRPRTSVVFAIHDDNSERDGKIGIEAASLRLSTRQVEQAHSQASQKQPANVPAQQDRVTSTIHPLRTSRLAQAPKRPAIRLSTLPEQSSSKKNGIKNEKLSPRPTRPTRRGTLYIPTDDTTMPSMYMGIFSPIKKLETRMEGQNNDESAMEMTGIAAQMAVKRGSRKSMMNVAPRRAPLELSARPLQETTTTTNRYGQGGGKENVPPGSKYCEKPMLDLKLITHKEVGSGKKTASPPRQYKKKHQVFVTSCAFAPTTALSEKTKISTSPKISGNQQPSSFECSKPVWDGASRQKPQRLVEVASERTERSASSTIPGRASKPKVPSRFVVPIIKSAPLSNNHALIPEEITKSDMYDENWLAYQEIAMTQLVNSLFQASRLPSAMDDNPAHLRQLLLDKYGTDEMLLMYKRLQAALLFGTLSIPQETLEQGEGLIRDLGRKQRFVDLWLQTYDHAALEAALEVVVGRQCQLDPGRKSESVPSTRTASKKILQAYIEAFLLRNEDGIPGKEAESRSAWSYQRTVHRSLMLVKVLDLSKTDMVGNMTTSLFQSQSAFKSSIAVVHALFQMLNTAVGDPIRALGLISYQVHHIQSPLEEFDYTINNLAVDLRDGVRLTRLVELLLYPSASRHLDREHDLEATTTILMPEGESVAFENARDRPMSQHLKLPCQARVLMLWNVQLALSAVQSVKGMSSLIEGITAEDIVNGYREKTIRLLWALVGKWGLTGLLDWEDVKWETRRISLQSAYNIPHTDEDENDAFHPDSSKTSFGNCKHHLKTWARTIATSNDIPLHDFTTSFADGKIFQAIVNEYEPFFLPQQSPFPAENRKLSLSQRLMRLGCSSQFAQLFSSNTAGTTRVFDRDFVLAALAFLCSRLLAPSKRTRAAVVIQRGWRGRWNKIEMKRKEQKKMVAVACVDVVSEMHRRKVQAGKTKQFDVICKRDESEAIVMSPESVGGSDIWLSL